MTTKFDEVFGDTTPKERAALVWRLAEMRARQTIEALLPKTEPIKTPKLGPSKNSDEKLR